VCPDLFVGQLRSSLTCSHCGFCSTVFDPFWDLSLPIAKVTEHTHTHARTHTGTHTHTHRYTHTHTQHNADTVNYAECKIWTDRHWRSYLGRWFGQEKVCACVCVCAHMSVTIPYVS